MTLSLALPSKAKTKHSLILLLLILLNAQVQAAKRGNQNQQANQKKQALIEVINKSKRSLDVFWIHPITGELQAETISNKRGQFLPDTNLKLNSFVGHSFEIRELPSVQTGECGDGEGDDCHSVQFRVIDNYVKYVIHEDWSVQPVNSDVIKIGGKGDALSHCEEMSKLELNDASSTASTEDVLDELLECVKKVVSEDIIHELHRMEDRQNYSLQYIAALWSNYNCLDNKEDELNALREYTWVNDKTYPFIKVLLEKPNSQIHYIPNFISQEECEKFTEVATPNLSPAKVAAADGGSTITESFRAMSSSPTVPLYDTNHPITRTYNRVFEYTNHLLQNKDNGFTITHHGQETPMYVQYNGDKTTPGVYQPHTDFITTQYNHTHRHGTRIATMQMYCSSNPNYKMNFLNAGVSIKPKKYSAIFVSYINSTTFKMDDDGETDGDEGVAYSMKRSCPLYEGQMNVITQYVRYGVSDELPWSALDNLGMK